MPPWTLTHLVLHQPVAGRALLAAGPGPVIEVVLLTLIAAAAHEARPALAAPVLPALQRQGPLGVAVTGCGARKLWLSALYLGPGTPWCLTPVGEGLGKGRGQGLPRSTGGGAGSLTFATFRPEPEVVDLTTLAALASDAWLALTLPRADVTLPVGGAQGMAVAPESE